MQPATEVVGRLVDPPQATAVATPVMTATEPAGTAPEEAEHEALINELILSFPAYTRETATRLLTENGWDWTEASRAAMRPGRERIQAQQAQQAQREREVVAGGDVVGSQATPVETAPEPAAEAMLAS